MSEFFTDLRHASRILGRAPGFAALAITILSTGIGASTVMYTLVQSVLLRELPFQEPERLVWMYNTRAERDRAPLSVPDVEDYRQEASSLAGLAVFTNWTTNLTGLGTPERLDGVRVSGNFFELLGTSAALGRTRMMKLARDGSPSSPMDCGSADSAATLPLSVRTFR